MQYLDLLRCEREVLSFQAPVAKHAETWISQEDEAGSDDNDERIISEYRSSIEFAKVLDEGQFYPRLGDVHVFKASQSNNENFDPFFISWALRDHRTSLQSGAKVYRYKCAGCMVCTVVGCPFTARPRTRDSASQLCGNLSFHSGKNDVPLQLQVCDVEFRYSTDFSSGDVTLTVSGTRDHAHERPPPKHPGPAAMAVLSNAVKAGKRPTATGLMISSSELQSDRGSQDAKQIQRIITELYRGRYGDDLSAAGLFGQHFEEPFVREVRVAYGEKITRKQILTLSFSSSMGKSN